MREKLTEKLVKRDGTPANVVVMNATETTASRLGLEISKAVEVAVKSYGKGDVHREEYALPAMTMEEIRFAMARYAADILIVPVVRPDAVDLFLFDKRTPYNLYAHSEEVPPEFVATGGSAVDPQTVATTLTRVLIKRLLFRYLNNQYFELPREESLPVLQAEIPQWIASPESLNLVNREITSRFYLSASLGAAINMPPSRQLWNSNLIGLQAGVRLWDKFFLEGQFSSFSYNAFVGSIRYQFINRDSPFRINVGLGGAFVTRDKVWNLDQTVGMGRYSYYIVPSAAVLFPIGEVYLKLETQVFVSPGLNKFIWTFMPGIQVHF